MPRLVLFMLFILVGCQEQSAPTASSPATAESATPLSISDQVKADTETLNRALIEGDYDSFLKLTHEKLIEAAGGKEQLIKGMEQGQKQMAAQGFQLDKISVLEPGQPMKGNSELYIVSPFTLTMKAPGGTLTKEGYLVGVSADEGKTWTYLNGLPEKESMKRMLPDLPDALSLPAPSEAVFTPSSE
ncbi:MAG: hypothetical protein KDA78_15290, partial [Planctomycetaceae bacterium]|nr:hypothetical protein [Planctomycetaceae bacterium]